MFGLQKYSVTACLSEN